MILDHPQGLNRYSYVRGNPTNDQDPDGGEDTEDLTNEASPGGVAGGGGTNESVPSSPDSSTQNASDIQLTTTTNIYVNATPDTPAPDFSTDIRVPSVSVDPENLVQLSLPTIPCNGASAAPPPSTYATAGSSVEAAATAPIPYPGMPGMAAAGQNAINLLDFHGGGPLDAQAAGSTRSYANYVYGVYTSAAGMSLSQALEGANDYANYANRSYAGQNLTMDSTYTYIPAVNVTSITLGYQDQQNGSLCSIN